MKYAIATALLALGLAACNGGSGTDADADGDGKVSSAELTAENKKDGGQLKPKPGKYKVDLKFVSAEGLPKEMQEIMKAQATQSREECVTPEEAEQGFAPPPDQLDGDGKDGCKISKYDIEGNKIEMALSCKGADAKSPVEMSMTGTVSETKQDITLVTKGMMMPGKGGSITMNMKLERIGDCDS